MQITFPAQSPLFNGANLTLEFVALVEGKCVRCSITAEALRDHCDAPSILEHDLLSAFAAKTAKIHQVCQTALKINEGGSVILRSGFFRAHNISDQ